MLFTVDQDLGCDVCAASWIGPDGVAALAGSLMMHSVSLVSLDLTGSKNWKYVLPRCYAHSWRLTVWEIYLTCNPKIWLVNNTRLPRFFG
jgi:hypothetical protein